VRSSSTLRHRDDPLGAGAICFLALGVKAPSWLAPMGRTRVCTHAVAEETCARRAPIAMPGTPSLQGCSTSHAVLSRANQVDPWPRVLDRRAPPAGQPALGISDFLYSLQSPGSSFASGDQASDSPPMPPRWRSTHRGCSRTWRSLDAEGHAQVPAGPASRLGRRASPRGGLAAGALAAWPPVQDD